MNLRTRCGVVLTHKPTGVTAQSLCSRPPRNEKKWLKEALASARSLLAAKLATPKQPQIKRSYHLDPDWFSRITQDGDTLVLGRDQVIEALNGKCQWLENKGGGA